MTHVQNPPISPTLPMITATQLPPIGEMVWRNMVADEIQSHPERYILGHGIDPEAKAIAAGQLARRDFNEDPEPDPETEDDEPIAAEAKWDETARRDKVASWIVMAALAIFFGFVLWAVVVISA